jgi:DNA-directed RNA polymerase specialized sigma24 family protein
MPADPSAITVEARFADIYTAYRARVAAYIAPQTRGNDRHLVEDLTSETFIRAWRALPQLQADDDTKLFAWLATIARHAVADYYRVARNVREIPADTGDWRYANRNLAPAASGAYEPVRNGHAGDSDPDPDEALRRVRESKPRALAGAR